MADAFMDSGAALIGLYTSKHTLHQTANKEAFHRHGKRFLKELAKRIGATEFEVRSNKAGPAVPGEITLHTPHVYIQLTSGTCMDVMYRSCMGMKDYRGGQNQWASMESFFRPGTVERIMQFERAGVLG